MPNDFQLEEVLEPGGAGQETVMFTKPRAGVLVKQALLPVEGQTALRPKPPGPSVAPAFWWPQGLSATPANASRRLTWLTYDRVLTARNLDRRAGTRTR